MPFRIRIVIILLTSFCVYANAYADELRYLASFEESEWMLTSATPTLCRVEHAIPRFGKLVFSRAAGRGLRLRLTSLQRFEKNIAVELVSESASWSPQPKRISLGQLQTNGRMNLISISGTVAERVLSELTQGSQPGFLFALDSPKIASISTVRFGDIEAEFSQCIRQLHPYNFDDIRISSIHFDSGEEFPRIAEEKSAFRRMFDYLAVDNAVSEIVLTGHTDSTGLACYNDRLSQQRAAYVYDLLIARGIPASLLRVANAAEVKSANKKISSTAAVTNRRVTVELRR